VYQIWLTGQGMQNVELIGCGLAHSGLEVEGIFRRSASAVVLKKVQQLFNEGKSKYYMQHSEHT